MPLSRRALPLLALPAVLTLAMLSGCGGSGSSAAPTPLPPTPTPVPPPSPTAASTIKHIVIVVQENRSFDNLFNGFPGADTVTSGMSKGQVVQLQPVPYEQGSDPDHSHEGWYTDYDGGKMDGFAHPNNFPIPNLPYAYVPQTETVPIWTLARAYTLGDRVFQSNTGPSWHSRTHAA